MELWRKLSGQEEKMKTLGNNFEALESQAADVKTEVEGAELQTGKKRKYEVENWLRNVERMKNEVQNLEQEVRERKISLLLLGNRVDKLNAEIALLCKQCSFQGKLLLDVCATRGESLLATELIVGKTSQAVNIYNKLIENSKTSHHVFWCTVSKDHDYSIGKLQSDIAKCLKLDLSNENDEKKRAAKLSQAFARRDKCALFLDDVWDKIDLHRVGIPNGCKLILTTRSVDVCHKMGCKELKVEPLSKEEAWNLFWKKLCNGEDTTLSPEVIDIAKFVAAKCDGLPLGIITMAGSMRGVDDIREWRNVFEELKERTMGHEDMERDVLPSLELSYSRLNDMKLKHCFLYCALYPEDWMIARNELIRYFIAERLIDRSKSLIRKFDKGHTILNKLGRSCLLEHYGDDKYAHVKMHDLIRDMALKIIEMNHHRVMVKAGVGLKEIPDLQECAGNLEKVSLMCNNIKEIPCGQSPRCPSLSTLILKHNPLKSIASSFFKHMHALQVLDLSDNSEIKVLPNSVSDLVKLTGLFLARCTSLTYVPPLGKLRALEELDLSFTGIEEVPQGVGMLVNLKNLNMEGTEKLEKIPSGTLSKLSHLQCLELQCRLRPVKIQAEELEELTKLEEFNVHLDDVHSFNRIVKFLQHQEVPLGKYFLQLGDSNFEYFECKSYSKAISWMGEYYITKGREEDVSFLPYDLEALTISDQWFTSDYFCDVFPSFWGNARHLQFSAINNCRGIEGILSACSSSTSLSSPRNEEEIEVDDDQIQESHNAPFQSVEILMLSHLQDLRGLLRSRKLRGLGFRVIAPHGTFSNLRKLGISFCDKMNSVFMPGLQLPHLEEITVKFCDEIKEIFDHEGVGTISSRNSHDNLTKLHKVWLSSSLLEFESICQGMGIRFFRNNHNMPFILPKLKKLQLESLPKLESICEGMMVCSSIEEIHVSRCPKLKRLPFFLPLDNNGQASAPMTLKEINVHRDWWESLEWDPPNVKAVLQPYLRFDKIWEIKTIG
ncbi:hypothetical protein TEA_002967 [Camellia sinensis var. sinensis]|uniref:Uncharacterized protein n=1 Tax=Camellia sinensis var. sinensis TaxID=542762 RepID=A0A4S4DCW8_CAMSN|nr:hypothetical protein TEA_002967 [Camellia sinensis var. sinensis]